MQTIKILIPAVPPSTNKYMGRVNRWEYQKDKKEWHTLIRACIKSRPLSPLKKAIVRIHYDFPNMRRRDPDNYAGKFIMDALTAEGIIEDDSFTHIQLMLSASFGTAEATEITVIEVE